MHALTMRLLVRAGWLSAMALTLAIIPTRLIACSSFEAASTDADAATDAGGAEADTGASSKDDGATTDTAVSPSTCTTDTCADAGVSCRAYDFSGTACPPEDWTFGGTDASPDVIKECKGGSLHVAAKNTLDAVAMLRRKMPGQLSVVRVSLRFVLVTWDGRKVFEIRAGNPSVFTITALENAQGAMDLKLCVGGGDCVPLATVPFDAEHILIMELGPTGISAAVNCGPLVTRPGQQPSANGTLGLDFGHLDGNPMDGTIRDVVVSFR